MGEKKTVVVASNNKHKIEEMRAIADLLDSDDLTDDGRDFAAALLGPVL